MPGKLPSGCFYHIFVHSFSDSNGDGIGDLRGITQRLDYLEQLGIDGIWLSPIHPSETYHKYDVLDYYGIDPQFGTMADFEELLAQCHRRGIRIVLDLVLNCSGRHHPAFLKALEDPTCPERGWYWFADSAGAEALDHDSCWNGLPSWHTAENGQQYIGIYGKSMPDYRFEDPGIREECKRIARFWLEKGVDGFRLDSAMHLYSTSEVDFDVSHHERNISWWQEFREYCRSVSPECLLIGEVWTESGERALYYKCLDSSFHFYLGNYIQDMLQGRLSPVVFNRHMTSACRSGAMVTPDYVDAPFLTNHDMPRFAETSGFGTEDLKLSAAIYLTLEGIRFVYYGEELGLAPYDDDDCPQFPRKDSMARSRTAFPWEEGQCGFRFRNGYKSVPLAQQQADPDSLLNFYRRVIRLCRENKALRHGRWTAGDTTAQLLSYHMTWGSERITVYHNLTQSKQLIPMPAPDALDLMTGQRPAQDESGRWILLPKHSTIFYINQTVEDEQQ